MKDTLQNFYKNKQNATFDQRLLAYVIDSLVCSVITGFAGVAFSILLIPLYFICSQVYFNQTLGKYFLGLKVISENQNKHVRSIIFRETIGKFISFLFLGLGYLKIFIGDRNAWHDNLARTRVVSLKPIQKNTGLVLLKTGALCVSMVVCFLLAFYYMDLYTTFPVEIVKKKYEKKGVKFSSVSGSVAKGFKFKNFEIKNSKYKISIENLNVKINQGKRGLKKLDFTYNPNINLIAATNVHIKELEEPVVASKIREEKFKLSAADILPRFRLGLEKLLLNKINFERANGKTEKIDLIAIDKMITDRSFCKINLAEFNTKDIFVNLKNIQVIYQEKELRFSYDVNLKRNGKYLKNLKRDVNVNGKLLYRDNEKASLSLSAFNDELSVDIQNYIDVNFKINNFTPAKYFKSKSPFKNINLYVKGSYISGSFNLRNRKFNLRKQAILSPTLEAKTDGGRYIANINTLNMIQDFEWMQLEKENEKYVIAKKSPTLEVLSGLYLNKSFAQLKKPKNKRLLKEDLKYLNTGPFVNVLPESTKSYLAKKQAAYQQSGRSLNIKSVLAKVLLDLTQKQMQKIKKSERRHPNDQRRTPASNPSTKGLQPVPE